MKPLKFILLCIPVALIISSCSSPQQQTAPKKLKVALGYIENIQFAPFYIAKNLGYFSEQGIEDVEFIHGFSPDILANVGIGSYDIALADGDEIIKAQSKKQPIPLEPFFGFYQTFPISLLSLSEIPLQSLQDLVGKKVGIPGAYGSSYDGLIIALKQVGISPQSFSLLPIGYTQIENLLQGNIDIAVVYSNNEPLQLASLQKKYSILPLSSFVNLTPATLVSNNTFAKKNARLLTGFSLALKKAMQYCASNPEQATALVFKNGFIPQLHEDNQEKALAVLKESITLWGDSSLYGEINQERWTKSRESLQQIGALE